jgi:hypothetical protein
VNDYDIDDGLPTSLLGSLLWLAVATALYAGGVLLILAAAVRRELRAPESAKPPADDAAAVFVPPSAGFW